MYEALKRNEALKALLVVVSAALIAISSISTSYSLYVNNVPKTHNGHIIYVSQRYNKFYNYDWTDVEVLTYSGDSHHIRFWGHPDFELNTNYHIHTIIRCRFYLFPVPSWQLKQLITELEVIS